MSRLYFQSVGDPNDQSISQKLTRHCEENPEELRREVKRLENKVLGLNSAVERQQKDLEEVNEEVILFPFHLFGCLENAGNICYPPPFSLFLR